MEEHIHCEMQIHTHKSARKATSISGISDFEDILIDLGAGIEATRECCWQVACRNFRNHLLLNCIVSELDFLSKLNNDKTDFLAN